EGAAEARVAARRPLPEDLRVGEKREPELTPDEASARRRDGEEELGVAGQPLAGGEDAGVDPAQHALVAQRVAPVRERDDGAGPGGDERAELVLRLAQAACRERRPLRVERERLAGRERVKRRGGLERELLAELLPPELAHLVRLPHEIRACRERGLEV